MLRDEASAIAALEWLPMERFPPLFMAAFAGKHSRVLKAMVQAWPFPCLPLGALMNHRQPYQDILQDVLEGLDALLAQDTRPRYGGLSSLVAPWGSEQLQLGSGSVQGQRES
ncbi:Putative PRAME family member 25 [Myotis davidii]|uniref:Putative PRAME family member 25 n=1 Tax=Myotis davidii TaxID=225400 RepID=L5MBS3_MYODS|nr:Putative PRAME family member 25 [Myotis davidii]